MKKFTFHLQRILGLRESEEQLFRQQLMNLLSNRKREEELMTQFVDQLEDGYIWLREKQTFSTQELVHEENYLIKIKSDILGQKLIIMDIDRRIKQKQDQIINKQKEVKVLQRIKDVQYETYQYDVALEDRKFMDELASRAR